MTTAHYRRPGRGTAVANGAVRLLTRLGISLLGSRVLTVVGRSTGQPRSTPVNLLVLDGARYLVAARGQTHWVRNLRAAGVGELRIGRRVETFAGREVADADKPEILRAYLKRWKFEVGVFFDGVDASTPTERLLEIAPRHPIFEVRDPAEA